MPKVDKREHRLEWEREPWAIGWLKRSDTDPSKSFCKVCKVSLRSHSGDLQKHAATTNHKNNASALVPPDARQRTLPFAPVISAPEKERDLKLAMYVAMHSSIRSMDHLCEVLKIVGKGTSLEKLQMHRTKCGNLIKFVIAPCLLEDLITDVGDMEYSLIVDESTEVSVIKYLCTCIKYFSVKQNRIITDYLGIVALENGTANVLYASLKQFLLDMGLRLVNCTGLGTDDGANALCGRNHSLYTLLKQDCPNLRLIKCICHSLNKAASVAAKALPSNVEFLIHQIYNWFHVSSNRRIEYKKLFDVINAGDTRWLSCYKAVDVILEQWVELRSYFNHYVQTNSCYMSRQLKDMLNDNTNLLFLTIIKPILREVNKTNIVFQGNDIDLGKAHEDLVQLLSLLASKMLTPTFLNGNIQTMKNALSNELAFRKVDVVDFGIEYYRELRLCDLSMNQRQYVETRAFNYLKTLAVEVAERITPHIERVRKLTFLSPSVCLSQTRPRFEELPFFDAIKNLKDAGVIENQWNKILHVRWLENNPNLKSYELWPLIYSYTDAGGTPVFRELALLCLSLLCLPTTNAVVERVFSVMNAIKTKVRNRMKFALLDALLRIRVSVYSHKLCCKDFKPTENMIKKFKYDIVYPTKSTVEIENKLVEDENVIFDIVDDM